MHARPIRCFRPLSNMTQPISASFVEYMIALWYSPHPRSLFILPGPEFHQITRLGSVHFLLRVLQLIQLGQGTTHLSVSHCPVNGGWLSNA
jgi:hypothetical protein